MFGDTHTVQRDAYGDKVITDYNAFTGTTTTEVIPAHHHHHHHHHRHGFFG